MITRKLTIIESPYSDDDFRVFSRNVEYLRSCLRDSWSQGELPFASHGYFPFFLHFSETNRDKERQEGIEAGYQFWDLGEVHEITLGGERTMRSCGDKPRIAFYVDLGMSSGMKKALERCQEKGYKYVIRTLNPAKETV